MANQPSREEQIVNAVLQFATREERAAYLTGACAGDAALLKRVEDLLQAHEQAADSPDPDVTVKSAPPLNPPATEPLTEKPGDRIGRYKLLQEIGEGGMGSVWMAEQEEPVRRRVALKVVKLGMDTRQVIARFEAERQALALMDHPNIAKVLDAGATDTGRPFFVMELVRGVPITEYCDQNNLSPQQRLELFVPVCKAIQHAHQKGIIHRDIKPSNILVTLHDGVPVPKVIDFGIAKAIDQPLTEKTLFTRFEQFMGTPAYMSPEQAEMSGLDIDTRSDIYALGVLLYELLTGKPPFDPDALVKSGVDAMRKTIREVEPSRPSTRLSTLAAADLTAIARKRGTEPARLSALVRGDLDWIVMKCLEKDRTRRYETANGLAVDVQRHLDNEPVAARPPSTAYRFQKAFRRHKLVFAAGGTVFAVLILGVIGTTVGFLRSERQRHVAETAQHLAQENFDQARAAVGDLLAVSDEDLYDLPGMQPLREKLMRAAIERYKPFLDRPSADPAPRAELARLYVKYGFTASGNGADAMTVVAPAYESALAIQQQLVREHPENRALRSDLGWTCFFFLWGGEINTGKRQQALAQSIAIFEALVDETPNDPLARADLGWALWRKGLGSLDDSGSRAATARALAIREQLVKEFPQSAEFRRELATSLQWQSRLEDDPATALDMLSRATDLRTALAADMEQNGPSIWLPSRPRDAEARLIRPSLVWVKRDVAFGCAAAAYLRGHLKQWPEALALSDRATGIYRQLVEQNPSVRRFVNEFGAASDFGAMVIEAGGDADAAQAHRLEVVNFLRGRMPADDTQLARALSEFSLSLLGSGKFSEAEPTARESLAIYEKKLPDDWRTFNARSLLGGSLLGQNKYADAEPLLLSGYEGLKQREDKIARASNPLEVWRFPEENQPWLKEAVRRLVQLYEATGRPDQAAQWKKTLAATATP
ncbi:MAG TPA: protein kinase [Verrucomicrobiae bacterium]|nr:protein kinase [Verrucomicrobiae bacterium]